jgi:hypothetical protein
MRAYLIDEISPSDMENIKGFLRKNAITSNLAQIVWVPIPDPLLSDSQLEHLNCRPHVFAVEMGPDWLKVELYIRSLGNLQCTCPGYCSAHQRDHIINFTDDILEQLGVTT